MRQSTLLPTRNDKTDKGFSFAPEIAIPRLLKWASHSKIQADIYADKENDDAYFWTRQCRCVPQLTKVEKKKLGSSSQGGAMLPKSINFLQVSAL